MAERLTALQRKKLETIVTLVCGFLALSYLMLNGLGSGIGGLIWLGIYGMVATVVAGLAKEFICWFLDGIGAIESAPLTPEQVAENLQREAEYQRQREARRRREHQFSVLVAVLCFLAFMAVLALAPSRSQKNEGSTSYEVHYDYNSK